MSSKGDEVVKSVLTTIRKKIRGGDVELTPSTLLTDLPLDSLAWLDLLFELEAVTGSQAPAVSAATTLGDIAREFGVSWPHR
jgi:acyl carrier protein